MLVPVYALRRYFSSARVSSELLGFMTLAQMTAALVRALEEQLPGVRLVEVPELLAAGEE